MASGRSLSATEKLGVTGRLRRLQVFASHSGHEITVVAATQLAFHRFGTTVDAHRWEP